MTTSSIGTGQTYTLPQTWFDDAPVTLTADWIGQQIAEEITAVDAPCVMSGVSRDGFTLRLEAASGASFKDVIGSDGPLRYLQAGSYARLRATGSFASGCVYINNEGGECSDLQVATTHVNNSRGAFRGNQANVVGRNLIVGKEAAGNETVLIGDNGFELINSLVHSLGDSIGVNVGNFITYNLYNVTIVTDDAITSTQPALNISGANSTGVIKNTLVFGHSDLTALNGSSLTISDSSTDDASTGQPTGTNLTYSASYTDCFENLSTPDYRAKASGAGDATGTRDQTNTSDLDIYGSSRDTTTPDQGCHEIASGAAATILPQMMQHWSE